MHRAFLESLGGEPLVVAILTYVNVWDEYLTTLAKIDDQNLYTGTEASLVMSDEHEETVRDHHIPLLSVLSSAGTAHLSPLP